MLNRYTDPEGWARLAGSPQEAAPAMAQEPQTTSQAEGPSAFSGLRALLEERLGGISTDTLVLAALVYFLVADREEADDRVSDTLLIIGALLLFGL